MKFTDTDCQSLKYNTYGKGHKCWAPYKVIRHGVRYCARHDPVRLAEVKKRKLAKSEGVGRRNETVSPEKG